MKTFSPSPRAAFTLLELLTVMAIIITLAGIVLAGVGYAQQKAARDRATAEIAALGAALESYKADNGEYPRNATSDGLQPTASANAPALEAAQLLYSSLNGKYFPFKWDMLNPAPTAASNDPNTARAVIDPFGNNYGYSTRYLAGATTNYNNPTYDLWSTGGTNNDQAKWISNW